MAKILVVDDEDDLRELITEELDDVGHTAIDFSGGQAALDYLAKDSCDLILSDITMPEMTGYQFFRAVKEQFPEHTNTPFIFMTALSDRSSEIKGLRLGADDYVTKPIDYDLLLLRVEGHLRRRQPAALAPIPSGQPAAPLGDKAAEPNSIEEASDAAAKLKAILQTRDGRAMASRFATNATEDIRDQILQAMEAAIREHLTPGDVLTTTPSHDFFAYFADLDSDEIEAKTSQIRDEIWERLFSLTNDADLSNVDAQSQELALDVNTIGTGDLLQEANKAVEQEIQNDIASKKKQLEQLYSFEKLHANPLLVATGSPSKIKTLSFSKKTADKIKTLSSLGRTDGPFLLEVQEMMFGRLKEIPNASKAFAKSAMLLPLPFPLTREGKTRDGLIKLCQELEESMGLILIIEIIATPDRLKPYQDVLNPLPVGRQLQFMELRRPQQANGLVFKEISVAYVSMSFSDLEACPAKERTEFIDGLQQQDVKLYVKDIPEGKLLDAQQFDGKLFSMTK